MKKLYLIMPFCLSLASGLSQQANLTQSRATFSRGVVDVEKEIENARFCGEIVVLSYDSVQVNSTWVLDKVKAARLDIPGNVISPNIHGVVTTGNAAKRFWPKAGDTCFVILDRNNVATVSLFGMVRGDNYIFWDPYSTQGAPSVLVFDAPFESYPPMREEAAGRSIETVTDSGKQFATAGYCLISKKNFWKLLQEYRSAGKGGC